MNYGPYMNDLAQTELAIAEVALKGATALAPSLLSIFGVGGGGSNVDPAGAQRQLVYQQKQAQQAAEEAAAAQAKMQAQTLRSQSSKGTDWKKILIYGGLGLIVLGAVGVIGYKVVKSRREP